MNATVHPINQAVLIDLVKADKIESLYAVAHREGWHVTIKQEPTSLVLACEDGPRTFPTLSALEEYLRELGITFFAIDVGGLDRNRKDSETMERLHEAKQAAEYDAWVRQQIQEALDEPRPGIPHSAVKKKFAARRAALLKKLAKA